MPPLARLLTVLALLCAALPLRAEVTVLVHGYLGSERSWHDSGVIGALRASGRLLHGSGRLTPFGPQLQASGERAGAPVYTVNLPSTAPVLVQARWLDGWLRAIRARHPDVPIVLVGHSAGGVVARATLVVHAPPGVRALVTIAAPHLGTWRALQALDALDTDGPPPWRILYRWLLRQRLGDPLYRLLRESRGVLHDLSPPRPGNLLHWLNGQPHPVIEYVSVIRSGGYRMPGDRVVPPFSQDMRRVPAIGAAARAVGSLPGHALAPGDGPLLVRILDALRLEASTGGSAAPAPPTRSAPR